VPDQVIRTTPRLRADGLDLDRLALALIEIVDRLPDAERKRLAAEGAELVRAAEREAQPEKGEGAA
jgi:hypothetical protein